VSLTGYAVDVSMNFDKLTMAYTPAQLGKIGDQVRTSYDQSKGIIEGDSSRAPVPFVGTTPASPGIYLRLGSGPTAIAGESAATGYENWIKIDSAEMGVGMSLAGFGPHGPREGTASVSELTFSQQFD